MAGPYGLRTSFEESVSATTATNSVELGTRRFEAGCEYVYAYNAGAEAAAKYVVLLSGVTGYSFVVTFASGADIKAQVLGVVKNATIAAGSYGWVCTRGFSDLSNDGTAAVAAGDAIVPSLNGNVKCMTLTSSITQYICATKIGQAMQATTTAGTFGAYVNVR